MNNGCEYGWTVFTTFITLVIRYAIAIFLAESNDAVRRSLAPFPYPTMDVRDFMQDIPLFIAVLTNSNWPCACDIDAEQISGTGTFIDTCVPPVDWVIEIVALDYASSLAVVP